MSVEQFRQLIEEEIEKIDFSDKEPRELYEPVRYVLSIGGKRIRPLLLLLSCDLFDGDIQCAVQPALGMEVFHNFTLLHDDIMDESLIRRGKPTVHKKWGINTAILSGDAMFVHAIHYFNNIEESSVQRKALACFIQTAYAVCEGQQYDMNFENQPASVSDYLKMIGLKTASLIEGSMKIGAIIAKTTDQNIDRIAEFGKSVGLAFQLQDDILDTFGDEQVLGKEVGRDIVANKKTFLMLQAMELANSDQRNVLEKWFGINSGAGNAEKVLAVKKVFDALDIKKLATIQMEKYFTLGLDALNSIPADNSKKENIKKLVQSLMKRRQ